MTTKLTKKLNTFLNPLSVDTWTPEGFNVLPHRYKAQNDVLFHAAALIATYGAAGYGVRKLQSIFGDTSDRDKIDKTIKEHARAQTPTLNPDPDINDDEELHFNDNPLIQKKAKDSGAFARPKDKYTDPLADEGDNAYMGAIRAGGLFIPALAAYTAYMYGHKKADDSEDKDKLKDNEKVITKLENIYQKANMQRMLSAKGYSPDEIKETEADMLKTAGDKAWLKELGKKDPSVRQSGDTDGTVMRWLRPASMIAMLGLGTLSYGSYKIGSHYLEEQDPERRKAKKIKQELYKRLASKQPTQLVADFDPKLKAILDKPSKKGPMARIPTAVTPEIESVPQEQAEDNLTELLNTA